MKVNFLDLKAQYDEVRDEVLEKVDEVFSNTAFTSGPYVKEFEENFAKRHNSKYCVAVNNGTSALHASMIALDVKHGDEVIVPANTFFASAEAVSLAGATPIFVDCETDYMNIDPDLIERAITGNTKAIIAVHLYGQPAQMDRIKEIADKNGLFLIEDSAQAHLAEYKGQSVGRFGIATCFSFYCGKNLGAFGEGGAILTDDEELLKKLHMVRDHGMSKKYHHEIVGHNYRMSGIQGAVLNIKMNKIDKWTNHRIQVAEWYNRGLEGVREITLPKVHENTKHVYHLFIISLDDREGLMAFLKENDIFCGLHYPVPCHLQPAYADLNYSEGDFPNSERLSKTILSLPMSEQISEEQVDYVCDKIKMFFNK